MGRLNGVFSVELKPESRGRNFTERHDMKRRLASLKTPITASIPEQKPTPTISSFDRLPDTAFVREAQLVQSPKRPDTLAPLPFSAPTLWRRVKAGTWPRPLKISERVSAWQVGECRAISAAWMAGKSEDEIRDLVKRLHAKRTVLATE